MLVRCRTLGTGAPGDPFRVPFPRYSTVERSIFGWMVVDVHPSCLPEGFPEPESVDSVPSELGRVRTALGRIELERLHRHFDETYQEHRGEFRPELL